jgi:iron(III) transport system ATP-binding protein
MSLELIDVSKRFGQKVILERLNLNVQDGEIVALLGASGSGKTTILRLIAGLFAPDAGRLLIGGREASQLAPEARGLGYVFQDYALMPHLTALENLTLVMPKHPERSTQAAKWLETVGMQDHAQTRPERLSGGQRQRVAIARALAVKPRLILLDEPYSALDPILREGLRGEVARLIRQAGCSALHVTHDPDEALAVADRLVVLGAGRVLENAAPAAVYATPSSLEGARALGRLNELEVVVRAGLAQLGEQSLPVTAPDGRAVLAWRWEQTRLQDNGIRAQLEAHLSSRGLELGRWRVGEAQLIAPSFGLPVGANAHLGFSPMVFAV